MLEEASRQLQALISNSPNNPTLNPVTSIPVPSNSGSSLKLPNKSNVTLVSFKKNLKYRRIFILKAYKREWPPQTPSPTSCHARTAKWTPLLSVDECSSNIKQLLTSSLSQQIFNYSVKKKTTLFRVPFLECPLKDGYWWIYLRGEVLLQISGGESEFSFTCPNTYIKWRHLLRLYFVRQAGDGPKRRISHLNFKKPQYFPKYFFLAFNYVLAKMAVVDPNVILPGNIGFTKQKSTYNLDAARLSIQVHFTNLTNILWPISNSSNNPKQVQNCVTFSQAVGK